MELDELPDVLTVEEAARFLRVGRTLAYQLARRYVRTEGREGLPVVSVGRNLRVPKVLLAKILTGELALAPVDEHLPPAPSSQQPHSGRASRKPQLSLLERPESD